MKGTLLLNYGENTKLVEEEERYRFLHAILEQMGIPISEFWSDGSLLSVDQKIKLRNILSTYSVLVIEDLDGHMQIYVDNELVGEWFKCEYKLKKDLRQIDPKKKLYLEMQVNYWSIFEEQESE